MVLDLYAGLCFDFGLNFVIVFSMFQEGIDKGLPLVWLPEYARLVNFDRTMLENAKHVLIRMVWVSL